MLTAIWQAWLQNNSAYYTRTSLRKTQHASCFDHIRLMGSSCTTVLSYFRLLESKNGLLTNFAKVPVPT